MSNDVQPDGATRARTPRTKFLLGVLHAALARLVGELIARVIE